MNEEAIHVLHCWYNLLFFNLTSNYHWILKLEFIILMKKIVFGIWTKSFLYLDLQKKKHAKIIRRQVYMLHRQPKHFSRMWQWVSHTQILYFFYLKPVKMNIVRDASRWFIHPQNYIFFMNAACILKIEHWNNEKYEQKSTKIAMIMAIYRYAH